MYTVLYVLYVNHVSINLEEKKMKEPENAKLSTIHKADPLLPPKAGTIQSKLPLVKIEKS